MVHLSHFLFASLVVGNLVTTQLVFPPTPPEATAASDLVGIILQNPTDNVLPSQYITFAHPFSPGQWFSDSVVVITATGSGNDLAVQANVKATHKDGSVKHAIFVTQMPSLPAKDSLPLLLTSTAQSSAPSIDLATFPDTSVSVSMSLTQPSAQTLNFDVSTLLSEALSAGNVSYWFQGPLATQARVTVPVVTSFRMAFDVTLFADGTYVVDIQFPLYTAAWLLTQVETARQFMLSWADTVGAMPLNMWAKNQSRWLNVVDYNWLWLDPRCARYSVCPTQFTEEPSWTLDTAHMPNLAYVPYLITGSRYYLDRMQAVSAFVLNNQTAAWQQLTGQIYGPLLAWGDQFTGDYIVPPWQLDYFVSTLSIAHRQGNELAGKYLQWSKNWNVGRFLHSDEGFIFKNGVSYHVYYGSVTNSYFQTWQELGQAQIDQGIDNSDWSESGGNFGQLGLMSLVLYQVSFPDDADPKTAFDLLSTAGAPYTEETVFQNDPTFSMAPYKAPSFTPTSSSRPPSVVQTPSTSGTPSSVTPFGVPGSPSTPSITSIASQLSNLFSLMYLLAIFF